MTLESDQTVPRDFLLKRLHSLTGLWLVLFVIVHLFTNSQAALFFGGDGEAFIRSVNSIHDLPYLPVIEIIILAFPLLIHLIWGVKILRTAKYNISNSDGTVPLLPYVRNRAYTWQRITSWFLILGIIGHVVHMRFIEYPTTAKIGSEKEYMVRITTDDGIQSLANRLGVKLYGAEQVQRHDWMGTTLKQPFEKNELIAVSKDFGTAELLMLRDTFKMPVMIVLYTLLVLGTCFHAFNGLWTLMITWGITLSQRSQAMMRIFAVGLMLLITFLGLAAVWFTYWINLRS